MTSAILLQDLDLLLGESFELVKSTDILIESGKIQAVGSEHDQVRGNTTRIDCKNLLAIPGFINAHTHVGDSVAMDLKIGGRLEELVHPVSGAKRRILNKTSRSKLIDGMKASISDMIACGTTTFVDFREGGRIGAELLKEALGPNPHIRAIILGRPILETDIEEEQAIISDMLDFIPSISLLREVLFRILLLAPLTGCTSSSSPPPIFRSIATESPT